MKRENELGNTLSEAELDEVRGGQLIDLIQRDEMEQRLKAVAESIDRLAVLDRSMFQKVGGGEIFGLPTSLFGR